SRRSSDLSCNEEYWNIAAPTAPMSVRAVSPMNTLGLGCFFIATLLLDIRLRFGGTLDFGGDLKCDIATVGSNLFAREIQMDVGNIRARLQTEHEITDQLLPIA